MNKNELEAFGQALIQQVRDYALDDYLQIKSGDMKSAPARELFRLIAGMRAEDKETLDRVVENIINRTVHHVLFMFEQSEDFTIVSKENISSSIDLVEQSDGLSGELYGETGWFSKYSQNTHLNGK
ncbi:MAG: hypothetical protein AAFP89_24135 [Bacteroidota bacterium]